MKATQCKVFGRAAEGASANTHTGVSQRFTELKLLTLHVKQTRISLLAAPHKPPGCAAEGEAGAARSGHQPWADRGKAGLPGTEPPRT